MSDGDLYALAHLLIFASVPIGAAGAYLGYSISERRQRNAHRDAVASYRVPSHTPGLDWALAWMYGCLIGLFVLVAVATAFLWAAL